MDTPYLVEIRTGGATKHELRNIINDVADEFGVYEVAKPRAVPHVPLFGRYGTDQGQTVKHHLVEMLSEFNVVPYRISGFDVFDDGTTVSANVLPSVELVTLRQQIADVLEPLVHTQPERGTDELFRFHVPIARNDREALETTAILEYVRERYDPQFDEYATRITSLRENEMLWEYDLLQSRVLTHREATTRKTWKQTEAALDERSMSTDHDSLVTDRVGVVIAAVKREGWRYYPDPHEYITSKARRAGLYRSDGKIGQRRLYIGDNYVYLVLPTTGDDICVFSRSKSAFYETTVVEPCPVCGNALRRYSSAPVLPCATCDFQYDVFEAIQEGNSIVAIQHEETCVRCKRPVYSDGVRFEDYLYCDECVTTFETIAKDGVVIQSRHGKPDYDDCPYRIQWDGTDYSESSQIAALARGKEIAETEGVPGVFIYRRSGSHWLLDVYLDAHPELESKVREKRRAIRGEERVVVDSLDTAEPQSGGPTYDIRADGDVFIADNAIKDAVVNRAEIGDDTQADRS